MPYLNMGNGLNSKHVVEQEKVRLRRTTFYMVKGITGVSVTREKNVLVAPQSRSQTTCKFEFI